MKDEYTITLTRHDVCNVMLACAAASSMSDGAKKWDILHDLIYTQMREQEGKE